VKLFLWLFLVEDKSNDMVATQNLYLLIGSMVIFNEPQTPQ